MFRGGAFAGGDEMTMKRVMLIAAVAASMAGAAVAQPGFELRFGGEAPGDFWYHAPSDIYGRILFLEKRVNRMQAEGRIDPHEWEMDRRTLGEIHADYDHIIADRGGLNDEQRAALWHKLKVVSERLHWQAGWGY
jgi:hypothetical protein